MSVEHTSEDRDPRGSIGEEHWRAALKAIARALARQAASQLWAGAMTNGGGEPSSATAAPTKPARQRGTRCHAGR